MITNSYTRDRWILASEMPRSLLRGSLLRTTRLHPLSMQSTIVNFSVRDESNRVRPIPNDWLKGAQLHVFRRLPGPRATIKFTIKDLALKSIPTRPLPKKTVFRIR